MSRILLLPVAVLLASSAAVLRPAKESPAAAPHSHVSHTGEMGKLRTAR